MAYSIYDAAIPPTTKKGSAKGSAKSSAKGSAKGKAASLSGFLEDQDGGGRRS